MPQITAWKCPQTGELFDSPYRYRHHLKTMAAGRIAERKAVIHRATQRKIRAFENNRTKLLAPLWEASSLEQIAAWVKENADLVLLAAMAKDTYRDRVLTIPDFAIKISLSVRWEPNGSRRFRQDGPGYVGVATIHYTDIKQVSVFSILPALGFVTGCGSGTTAGYTTDIFLPDEVWKNLRVGELLREEI